jgi:hypothetical protein
MISLLDYGAGNVRSLRNALARLGAEVVDVRTPDDILAAERLVFPGVGAFGAAMRRLEELGFVEPLRDYLLADRPFLGICIGLQCLFEGSSESVGQPGLGVIPGSIERFPDQGLAVPAHGLEPRSGCAATANSFWGSTAIDITSCTPIGPTRTPPAIGCWPSPTTARPSSRGAARGRSSRSSSTRRRAASPASSCCAAS